jgi:glycosyltransferase involved in cell wall biosynthesis
LKTPVTLSIALCTRNNCASLVQTLDSLRGLHVPLEGELLVIDNGSTDGTWEALRSYTHPILPVRRIMEETRGLCYARNRALAESKSDVIVFTDDDVRVSPGWIDSLVRPLLDGRADAVVGGIRLAPHLQKAWMTPAYLIGANMAFVRSVTAKVPEFDVELDPGRLGAWGDSLFSWQLREAGFRLQGAFDHEIEHHFAECRLSRSSLLRAARIQGVCRAYVSHHWQHESRPGFSRRLVRRLLSLAKLRAKGMRRQSAEGVPMSELEAVESIWLERQWIQEHRRPRHYAKRGLRRVVPAA